MSDSENKTIHFKSQDLIYGNFFSNDDAVNLQAPTGNHFRNHPMSSSVIRNQGVRNTNHQQAVVIIDSSTKIKYAENMIKVHGDKKTQ